jgi:catechol 2,3-dioxygenase-like lactoylglutathione lyase family enzyme
MMKFDHYELYVPDQLRASDWYRQSLGFEILQQHYHWYEEGGSLMISNDSGRTMLALFAGPSQADQPVAGFIRAAFRVSDGEFIGFMCSSGDWRDSPLDASNIQDHDQSISIYFEDPWGNRLEVTT